MIELTPQQQQFVDAQVATGVFKEPAEVVAAALILLSQRQREYAELKDSIANFDRGEYAPLDIEDVKQRGRSRRAKE